MGNNMTGELDFTPTTNLFHTFDSALKSNE